jgi:hypothetical protein
MPAPDGLALSGGGGRPVERNSTVRTSSCSHDDVLVRRVQLPSVSNFAIQCALVKRVPGAFLTCGRRRRGEAVGAAAIALCSKTRVIRGFWNTKRSCGLRKRIDPSTRLRASPLESSARRWADAPGLSPGFGGGQRQSRQASGFGRGEAEEAEAGFGPRGRTPGSSTVSVLKARRRSLG